VQKSFARVAFQDYLRSDQSIEELNQYRDVPIADTYNDRALQKTLAGMVKTEYTDKVAPTELITKQCGNSYCGSLYAGLLSLVSNEADNLDGKRIMMFSYGSGLAASMFSLKVNGDVTAIRDTANVNERLASRTKISPEEFERSLEVRENTYTKYDFKPTADVQDMFKGTYYLKEIDSLERRYYSRAYHTLTPAAAAAVNVCRPLPQRMVTPSIVSAVRPATILRGLTTLRRFIK
jgi:hydroxymethylglutaryl-CoA synthase